MTPAHAPHADRRRACAAVLGALALAASGTAPSAAELTEVVAEARGSVVAVGTYNPLDNPRFTFRGTGFVVDDGRRVVTNAHVLPPADAPGGGKLSIAVPLGRQITPEVREARVQALLPEADLAVLVIDGSALPALPLAADLPVRDGQAVALIGFPLGAALGLTPVTHRGIVGATVAIALPSPSGRQLDARTAARLRQGPFDIYQLDATAYPGSSGSPLLDAATGRVIGVINMVFVKGTKESALSAPSGITYAIPVRHVLEALKAR